MKTIIVALALLVAFAAGYVVARLTERPVTVEVMRTLSGWVVTDLPAPREVRM